MIYFYGLGVEKDMEDAKKVHDALKHGVAYAPKHEAADELAKRRLSNFATSSD